MELKEYDLPSPEEHLLREEVFCLNFELRTISGLLLRSEVERWIPGFIWSWVEAEHMARYEYACSWVTGKKVLDVACGSGYGSYLMAEKGKASQVVGGDIDPESIRYGRHRFKSPLVERRVIDAMQLDFPSVFDVAVSFETIEHLGRPGDLLDGIFNALKPNGIFIVSTPIAKKTTSSPHNPFHKQEWSLEDFHRMVAEKFTIEKTFLQSIGLKENKWIAKVRNKLQPGRLTMPDYGLNEIRKPLDVKKIQRGYQIIVCRKA